MEILLVGCMGREWIDVFTALEMAQEILDSYSPNVRSLFFVGVKETGNLYIFANIEKSQNGSHLYLTVGTSAWNSGTETCKEPLSRLTANL